jgi:hypothetical protein
MSVAPFVRKGLFKVATAITNYQLPITNYRLMEVSYGGFGGTIFGSRGVEAFGESVVDHGGGDVGDVHGGVGHVGGERVVAAHCGEFVGESG